MKKTLIAAVALFSSSAALANTTIEIMGLQYLEAGEELFRPMKTQDIAIGDVVTLVDKRDASVTKSAKVIKVYANSLIVQVQGD